MSSYRYQGVPLTPTVFASLTRELFPEGTTIARIELIRSVLDEHEKRGGLPSRGVMVSAAKKALAMLADAGEAEPIARGYWRITPAVSPVAITEPVVFGSGPEAVYVYYFPAYRDQAAYLQRDSWPMKIGMTKGEVSLRIKDQCGTAMPELPIVGMIFRTENAANAERLLHSTLHTRGRHLSGPGKEWFLTSVAEVRDILDFAAGSFAGR